MGTKYVARLYLEYKCSRCNGNGYYFITLPDRFGSPMETPCGRCDGKGRLWRQLTWTHAYTYEDALDKLLKRKHVIYGAEFGMFLPVKFYAYEDRFFLVWGKGAGTGPIDVTKAVAYKLHNWQAKEIYKKENSGLGVYCNVCEIFVTDYFRHHQTQKHAKNLIQKAEGI